MFNKILPETLQIYVTYDYDQFKFVKGNRPITHNHMIEAIKNKNLLASNPIKVNKDGYVIDGQHRLDAARSLKLPIYYLVDPYLTEDDIVRINTDLRQWKTHNYLHLYSERENPTYVFIDKMVKELKLPIHFLITCLDKTHQCYSKFNKGAIEMGDVFSIEDHIRKFSEVYLICKEACGKKTRISNNAMRVLWKFINHKNYVHLEFLEKCNKYPDKIVYAFSFKEAGYIKDGLVELFNYKRNGCNKVEFNW